MAAFQLLYMVFNLGSVYGACSYYQTNNISFPTDKCINSTMIDGKITSSGYFCYNGLFRTSVYHYTFDGAHCKGQPKQTYISACYPPTCNCANGNSASQCTLKTFTYDTNYCPESEQFDEQNLTVITGECINGKGFYSQNGRLVYTQFTDATCKTLALSHPTCFAHNYDDDDDDTDTDSDDIRMYTTTQDPEHSSNFVENLKGFIVMSGIGIMICVSFSSVCCMMKKIRRKQRHHVAEIDENLLGQNGESELNEEGIQREFVDEEQIVIPGQNEEESEIDRAVVDEIVNQYVKDEEENEADDIPIAAYSDFNGDDNDDNNEEIEISVGNEGVEEQHCSTDDSISDLSALDL